MIQNNLAWTLMNQQPPQLEEALSLANEVCENFPAVHSFRETRGQILIRQRQWEAALKDLTFAIEGMPRYVQLHESLAMAYTALGNKIAAQRHERLARDYAAEAKQNGQ
jgi:predicted Zn-dependent protease